jgi:hypothetical protein
MNELKLIIVSLGMFLVQGCNSHEIKTSANDSVQDKDYNTEHIKKSPASGERIPYASLTWRYLDEPDSTSHKPIHHAFLRSRVNIGLKNTPNEDIPEIVITKKDGESYVAIIIISGLFNTSSGGLNIKARFDDGAVYKYWCTSKERNRNVLVIQNKLDFISRIKNSKKVLINADFLDNGDHDMVFVSEENLQWN